LLEECLFLEAFGVQILVLKDSLRWDILQLGH